MEEMSFSDTARQPSLAPAYDIPQSRKSRKRFFILLLFIVFLVFAIFLGRSFFMGSSEEEEEAELTPAPTEFVFPTDTPTPTPENSPTPGPTGTPTPRPTLNPVDSATGLDRSDLTVAVQNGSGTVGAASRASEALKTFGYHVTGIGNADNFDYSQTQVFVKPEKSKYLDLLKKDLSVNYVIGDSGSTLSASASADALVIVGKE